MGDDHVSTPSRWCNTTARCHDARRGVSGDGERCAEFTAAALYPLTHFGTVPPIQESVMLTTFNARWRRHDGFGLLAIAVLIAAAMAAGYLTAGT